jgi:hypothetical protein
MTLEAYPADAYIDLIAAAVARSSDAMQELLGDGEQWHAKAECHSLGDSIVLGLSLLHDGGLLSKRHVHLEGHALAAARSGDPRDGVRKLVHAEILEAAREMKVSRRHLRERHVVVTLLKEAIKSIEEGTRPNGKPGGAQARANLQDALVQLEALMVQEGELKQDERTGHLVDCQACSETWAAQGCAACPERSGDQCVAMIRDPRELRGYTATVTQWVMESLKTGSPEVRPWWCPEMRTEGRTGLHQRAGKAAMIEQRERWVEDDE